MNQELKEKLHYYLPYRLICTIKNQPCKGETHCLRSVRDDGLVQLGEGGRFNFMQRSVDEIIPHMRPLSSLTKEIVVEGYNDGKPFVPIKILHSGSYGEFAYSTYGVKNDTDPGHWLSYTSIDCLDLLLKWHFWIGDQNLFETGEMIRIEN